MNTAEKIRLPDDCTIGYIIESVLGVPLTRSNLFHSHLENLQLLSRSEFHKQVRKLTARLNFYGVCLTSWSRKSNHVSCCCFPFVKITLSYGMFENKSNIIHLKGAFSVEEDSSR